MLELLEDYSFFIEGSSGGTVGTSTAIRNRRRYLFDEEYIENGCQPIVYEDDVGDDDVLYPPYPRGTAVDDTIGTYSTNYAAAAIAFVGAIILWMVLNKKKRQNNDNGGTTTTMMMIYYSLIWYLILFGISYTLAGINHQVVTNDYEGFDTSNFYLSRLSYCCALLSAIGFIITILNLKQLLVVQLRVSTTTTKKPDGDDDGVEDSTAAAGSGIICSKQNILRNVVVVVILSLCAIATLVIPNHRHSLLFAALIIVVIALLVAIYCTVMTIKCYCCSNRKEDDPNTTTTGGGGGEDVSNSIVVVTTTAKRTTKNGESNNSNNNGDITSTNNDNNTKNKKKSIGLIYCLFMISQYVLICGIVIQQVYSPVCGLPKAYEECFINCPFPQPNKYNHNFYYHLLQGISILFVIYGGYKVLQL